MLSHWRVSISWSWLEFEILVRHRHIHWVFRHALQSIVVLSLYNADLIKHGHSLAVTIGCRYLQVLIRIPQVGCITLLSLKWLKTTACNMRVYDGSSIEYVSIRPTQVADWLKNVYRTDAVNIDPFFVLRMVWFLWYNQILMFLMQLIGFSEL
jgi:hypothetical protein